MNTSLTEKFMNLKAGDIVDFGLNPLTITGEKQSQLKGKGTLHCLSGLKGNFTRNGEEYLLFEFDSMFFIKRLDGWFGFDQAIILEGDEVNQFNKPGELFCEKGQVPRSVSFPWKDKTLSILDVGYLEYQQSEGSSHLDTGDKIKYMLAEEKIDDNNTAIYFLENRKVNSDRMWIGKALGENLDRCIIDIFPVNR